MPLTRVLLVDVDALAVAALKFAIGDLAEVEACTSFVVARERLFECEYDRLVTNLRLRSYNGLHLVHLTKPRTRSVVYTTRPELFLQSEVQRIGAFYESYDSLRCSIASYLDGKLPLFDRRHFQRDRRCGGFRGGRRRSDACVSITGYLKTVKGAGAALTEPV
jgi:hypothetical protein